MARTIKGALQPRFSFFFTSDLGFDNSMLHSIHATEASLAMTDDKLGKVDNVQAVLLEHIRWEHLVETVKQGESKQLDLVLWGLPRIPTIVGPEFDKYEAKRVGPCSPTVEDGNWAWSAACLQIHEACTSTCVVKDWTLYYKLYKKWFPNKAAALIAYEDTNEDRVAACNDFGIESDYTQVHIEALSRDRQSSLDVTKFSDVHILESDEFGCQTVLALKTESPTILSDFIMEGVRMVLSTGHDIKCIKHISIIPCDWRAIELERDARVWNHTNDETLKTQIFNKWITDNDTRNYAAAHYVLSDGYHRSMFTST